MITAFSGRNDRAEGPQQQQVGDARAPRARATGTRCRLLSMKSTPKAGAPVSSTSVVAGKRAAGIYRSRMRCTRSTAGASPASLRPAARICPPAPRVVDEAAPAVRRRAARAKGARTVSGAPRDRGAAAATSRRCAATTAASEAPSAPVRVDHELAAARARRARACPRGSSGPRAASVLIGVPRLSPPVRCRSVAASASAISTAAARTKPGTGRRMIPSASRCQTPVRPLPRGARGPSAGSRGSG